MQVIYSVLCECQLDASGAFRMQSHLWSRCSCSSYLIHLLLLNYCKICLLDKSRKPQKKNLRKTNRFSCAWSRLRRGDRGKPKARMETGLQPQLHILVEFQSWCYISCFCCCQHVSSSSHRQTRSDYSLRVGYSSHLIEHPAAGMSFKWRGVAESENRRARAKSSVNQ